MAPSALGATVRRRHARPARVPPAIIAMPPHRLAARAPGERAYLATAAWAARAALPLQLAARRAASLRGARLLETAQRAPLVASVASALPELSADLEIVPLMVATIVRRRYLCIRVPSSTYRRVSVVHRVARNAQLIVRKKTAGTAAAVFNIFLREYMGTIQIIKILDDVLQEHSAPEAHPLVLHVCVTPATCLLHLASRIVRALMVAVDCARQGTIAQEAVRKHHPALARLATPRRPWVALTALERRAPVRHARLPAPAPAAARSLPARRLLLLHHLLPQIQALRLQLSQLRAR